MLSDSDNIDLEVSSDSPEEYSDSDTSDILGLDNTSDDSEELDLEEEAEDPVSQEKLKKKKKKKKTIREMQNSLYGCINDDESSSYIEPVNSQLVNPDTIPITHTDDFELRLQDTALNQQANYEPSYTSARTDSITQAIATSSPITQNVGFFGYDNFESYGSKAENMIAGASPAEIFTVINETPVDILDGDFERDGYSNKSGTLLEQSLNDSIQGTYTEHGYYESCNILPRGENEIIFSSKSESQYDYTSAEKDMSITSASDAGMQPSSIATPSSNFTEATTIPRNEEHHLSAEISTKNAVELNNAAKSSTDSAVPEISTPKHEHQNSYVIDSNHTLSKKDVQEFFTGEKGHTTNIFHLSTIDTLLPSTGATEKQICISDGIKKIHSTTDLAVGLSQSGNIHDYARRESKNERNTTSNTTSEVVKQEMYMGRKLDAAVKRSFSRDIQIWNPMCQTGNIIIQSTKAIYHAQGDNATAGKEEIDKYKSTGSDFIAAIGSSNAYKAIIEKGDQVAEASSLAFNAVTSGKITGERLMEALSKNKPSEVTSILKQSGLTQKEIKNITKFSAEIKDIFVSRDAFLEAASKNGKLFTQKELDFIKSKDFFNPGRNTGLHQAIAKKFYSSHPDAMIRSLGITNLSEKKLKKLIKSPEKYNLSAKTVSVLKVELSKRKQINAKKNISKFGMLGKVFDHIKRLDTAESAGLKQISHVYNGAKVAIPMAKLAFVTGGITKRFICKVTGLNYIGRQIKSKYQTLKNIKATKKKVRSEKLKKKIKESPKVTQAKKKVEIIKKSKVAQKAKKAGDSIKKVNRGSAILGRAVKRTARKTWKTFTSPIRFLLKPFNILSRGFNFLNTLKLKIVLYVGGALLVIIAVYLLLLCAFTLIINALSSETEAAVNMINTENLSHYVNILTSLDDNKFSSAESKGQGTPINTSVLGGASIKHYGYPTHFASDCGYHESISGFTISNNAYKVYYLDSSGNIISNHSSNAQDIISMVAVLTENNLEDTTATENILNTLWGAMNPDPTYVESSVFFCPEGCDTLPSSGKYKCDDSSFYSSYHSLANAGVAFYNSPVQATTNGCYCDGHVGEHTEDCEEECSYSHTTYCSGCRCDGHNALTACYGHKTLNCYITLLTKDDVYGTNGYIYYKVPSKFDSSGCITDWQTKMVDVNISSTTYQEEINQFKNLGGWENIEHQDLCDNYFQQDWYTLYGVEVTGGVGFQTGTTLTPEERQNILDNITAQYRDLNAARVQFVTNAMDCVGKIPYYWGGKPTYAYPDFAGNNIGSIVADDGSGRTLKGFDCSGFVSFVYWGTFNIKPLGMSTSNFTTLLGMEKISYSELVPGDIALMHLPGATGGVNHIGIYAGKNTAGQDLWIHCNSSNCNVSCNSVNYWRHYYRLF